jgi:hypothetical protein
VGEVMDKVLGGISIISIIGGIGLILELFLSREPEIYFFTKRKKFIKNLLAYSVVGFLMLVSAYIYLQIDIDISIKFISVIYSMAVFTILGSCLINSLKNYKLFNWINNKVQYILSKNIVIGCFIIVFFIYAGVLEKEILNRSIEMQLTTKEYFKLSIIGGLIITLSSTFLLRILLTTIDHYIRKVCSIRYTDKIGNTVKYYIYYAADKEFVVCGIEAKPENCKEFRFISILDIKMNSEVYIEKISME